METAFSDKKPQQVKKAVPEKTNTPEETYAVEAPALFTGQESLQGQPLTPRMIRHLQRSVGNQAVLRLLNKQSPSTKPAPSAKTITNRVQRDGTRSIVDQEHTIDDPGVGDLVGNLGGYLGTDPGTGPSGITGAGTGNFGTGIGGTAPTIAGGLMGEATGEIAIIINIYNLTQNVKNHRQANAQLEQLATLYYGNEDDVPGDTELYATIALLERQKSEAITGELENASGIVGGINGFINGVATALSTANVAGTAILGAVTFGIGAFLGALMGTIGAIRSFMSASKRSEAKKEIGKVRAGYVELYEDLGHQITIKQELNLFRQNRINQYNKEIAQARKTLKTLLTNDQPFEEIKAPYQNGLQTIADGVQEVQTLSEAIEEDTPTIPPLVAKYEDYGKMVTALMTAERKQGNKGKIGTGLLNLLSAGGGTALLIATLGLGASAGPVGWVLTGVALIGMLSYAIGMAVKRKIRKDNVLRMNEEISYVDTYIQTGNIPASGVLPDSYTVSDTPDKRKNDLWYRQMFPTKKKKDFLSKIFTKKKSGKITMSERMTLIQDYLGKYDVGKQAEVVTTGFIAALGPGEEGDQQVSNPAYSEKLTEAQKQATPQQITLRELNMGLLAHFFGDGANNMLTSLLSNDETKQDKAKELLAKKLKLG